MFALVLTPAVKEGNCRNILILSGWKLNGKQGMRISQLMWVQGRKDIFYYLLLCLQFQVGTCFLIHYLFLWSNTSAWFSFSEVNPNSCIFSKLAIQCHSIFRYLNFWIPNWNFDSIFKNEDLGGHDNYLQIVEGLSWERWKTLFYKYVEQGTDAVEGVFNSL